MTGYQFGVNSITVSQKTPLQSIVALSSMEVEYVPLAQAIKELIWLKRLIKELVGDLSSICLFYDVQSAIYLSKNQVQHERTKHIDVRMHFIRDEIKKCMLELKRVYTSGNLADMMTKSFTAEQLQVMLGLGWGNLPLSYSVGGGQM